MKTETVHDTIRSTAEIAACMTIIFSYLAFLTVEHEQLSRNLVNAAIGSAGTAVVFTAAAFIIAITKRRKRKRMKETLASPFSDETKIIIRLRNVHKVSETETLEEAWSLPDLKVFRATIIEYADGQRRYLLEALEQDKFNERIIDEIGHKPA